MKIQLQTFCILLASALILFPSCNEDDFDRSRLYGVWYVTKMEQLNCDDPDFNQETLANADGLFCDTQECTEYLYVFEEETVGKVETTFEGDDLVYSFSETYTYTYENGWLQLHHELAPNGGQARPAEFIGGQLRWVQAPVEEELGCEQVYWLRKE